MELCKRAFAPCMSHSLPGFRCRRVPRPRCPRLLAPATAPPRRGGPPPAPRRRVQPPPWGSPGPLAAPRPHGRPSAPRRLQPGLRSRSRGAIRRLRSIRGRLLGCRCRQLPGVCRHQRGRREASRQLGVNGPQRPGPLLRCRRLWPRTGRWCTRQRLSRRWSLSRPSRMQRRSPKLCAATSSCVPSGCVLSGSGGMRAAVW